MAIRRRPVQDSRVLRRRRRARRLRSAFVRLRFEATKPVGVFDASLVEWMLRSGDPDDAHYYLECFLHRVPVQYRVSSPLSYELIAQVGVFKTLAKVVAGGKEGAAVAALFADPSDYILRSPASVRLHKMIAVMHADRTRASQLWDILKPQALDTIMGLVDRCPELQGQPRLPRQRTLLREAAPHRLPPRCSGRRWKTTKHASAAALIHEFLQKRLSMTQGRKRSVYSSDVSSQSAAKCMKTVHDASKPANHHEAEGVSSNTFSISMC